MLISIQTYCAVQESQVARNEVSWSFELEVELVGEMEVGRSCLQEFLHLDLVSGRLRRESRGFLGVGAL
jgi:hypothetical protein